MPVTEIERLWLRFQQLDVSDEGTLPLAAMLQHPSFESDPFARVVIILFLFFFDHVMSSSVETLVPQILFKETRASQDPKKILKRKMNLNKS